MTFSHFGSLDYMILGMLDNGEKYSGIDQHFLECLVLFRFGIFGSLQIFIYFFLSVLFSLF